MNNKKPLMSLISNAFLTWRRHLQKEILSYNITLKQATLLRRLSNTEFLYPSDIAEMLFCDRPTASVVLKNMEKTKWIKKVKDPDNGKRIRILIAKAGLKKLQELDEASWSNINDPDIPVDCLTKEEKKTLERIMIKINTNLELLPTNKP